MSFDDEHYCCCGGQQQSDSLNPSAEYFHSDASNGDLPMILIRYYVEEVAYDAKSSTMSNYYEKIKRG